MPCQMGATCVDAVNGFGCRCVVGYEGVLCETNTDDCLPGVCLNNATCIDEVANFRLGSVCLFLCVSVCMYVYVCMSGCLYVCLYVRLSVCLFVCLSVCLFVCVSVCLSVNTYIFED